MNVYLFKGDKLDEGDRYELMGQVMKHQEDYNKLQIENFIKSFPLDKIEDISKWLSNS